LVKEQLQEVEDRNQTLKDNNESLQNDIAKLTVEGEQMSKELSSLRNRTNLSQSNWMKERQDLVDREAFMRQEFESAKQAMQDWEILAMEERSMRENEANRRADLEEQLANLKESYEKAVAERDSQSLTVDGLQRALQELQDGKRLSPMRIKDYSRLLTQTPQPGNKS
jgi:chromosome segregation ATPase